MFDNIFLQSVFVGIYCILLFIPLSYIIHNKFSILFVLGFCKHFLGFVFGIQSFFCKCAINTPYSILFYESIFEGALFVIFGYILTLLQLKKLVQIFIIGLVLHLLFEILSGHKWFCENRCDPV